MDHPEYLMLRAKIAQKIIDATLKGKKAKAQKLFMKLKILDTVRSWFAPIEINTIDMTKEPPKGALQLPYILKKRGRPRKASNAVVVEKKEKATVFKERKHPTSVVLSEFHRKMLEEIRGKKSIKDTIAVAIEVLYKTRKG